MSEPIAVPILEAAKMIGLSRRQFYRVFLDTKRILPIKTGIRDRVVDVTELRSAYEKFKAESRNS